MFAFEIIYLFVLDGEEVGGVRDYVWGWIMKGNVIRRETAIAIGE